MWHPHWWKEIPPTERPPMPGYVYYQCRFCGEYKREKDCWVHTQVGYANGHWQSKSLDGRTWTEPVKVV